MSEQEAFLEHVLIVEDDKAIIALLSTTLEAHGLPCTIAATGRAALECMTHSAPTVILLDLGLPDMNGVDIIKRLRQWSMVPIIVISARTEDTDKVDALDAGADDYLTKPFSVTEFLARLRAALRRAHYVRNHVEREDCCDNGPLHIDFVAGCVTVAGQELHLAPMEYRLLVLFARNVGKVLTHKAILQAVWGSSLEQNLPSLRVFMAMLRKKLESAGQCQFICTHVGIGYRMLRVTDGGTGRDARA